MYGHLVGVKIWTPDTGPDFGSVADGLSIPDPEPDAKAERKGEAMHWGTCDLCGKRYFKQLPSEYSWRIQRGDVWRAIGKESSYGMAVFCGYNCMRTAERMADAWRKAHPRNQKKRNFPVIRCAHCGIEFKKTGSRQYYCSKECVRQAALKKVDA